ncbi:MAG: threonine ammonia-lyase, biosynthetic, partial [Methylococcales bacterium]
EPFRIAHRYVDGVITVNTDEICAAIKDIFDDTRTIAEPAGALAVAGIKKYVAEHTSLRDQNLIAIESGANINFDRLRYVAERAEVGEHREVLFSVTIPEESGSFIKFCSALGKCNITEFNYRFFDEKEAQIFVGLAASGEPEERKQLIDSIKAKGFPVIDMTENELAKEHMRYMVGGHAPCLLNEIIYRFQFPERPGALLQFLSALGGRWNISLFHYRNHGAAFGKVLMGIQVPLGERKIFIQCLEALGFDYVDETQNPVYKIYAGGSECI